MTGGGERVSGREFAAVAAALLLLGALFTWPLARHLGSDVLYTHEATPGYERVPLAHGDHLQLLYVSWLFGDSVAEGRSLLEDPYQFRDGGPPTFLFQATILPVLVWALAPLGLVAAFNLLTLLSFVGSGLATHLLLRLGTADRLAAFAGALVAALFPFRVAQLAGHANGILAFLIPLWIYLFERSLRGTRRVAWAAAAGVVFFLAGSMEFHIAYYLTLFAGLYIPFRTAFPLSDWLATRPAGPPAPATALPHLTAALGGAGLGLAACHVAGRAAPVAPAAWVATPLLFAAAAWLLWRGLRSASLRYLDPAPADPARAAALPFAPLALLAAAPLGPLLEVPNLGRGAGLLAAAALLVLAVRGLRSPSRPRLRDGWRGLARERGAPLLAHAAAIGGTLGFLLLIRARVFSASVAGAGRRFSDVLAFSPRPADLLAPVNASGEKLAYLGVAALALAAAGAIALLRVRDPARRLPALFLAGTFLLGTLLAVGAHLPELPLYHLLFRTLPMFNFPRVAGRILLVSSVGLSVLVAAGVAAMRWPSGRPRPLLASWALLLLVLDYAPRLPMGLTSVPQEHPVYDRLAALRTPGEPVLELPVWPGDTAWTSIYLWWVTRYRTPLVNGYSPATPRDYVGRVFDPLYPLDFGELRRPQYDLLRELGVRFVLFHEDAYPRKISDFPFPVAAAALRASPYLETVAYEPPVWLFRLRERPPDGEAGFAHSSPVGSLWEGEDWLVPGGGREADPLASGGAVGTLPAGATGIANRPVPRRTYPTGSFRARARVLAAQGDLPGLTLVVKHAETGAVLGEGRLAPGGGGGGADVEALFSLPAPTPVFAEIVTDGSAPLRWDYLLITFAQEPEPRTSFEFEDLWHIGRPLEDPEASGGAAVRLIPGYHPRDWSSSGPDRVLPAGAWVAELRYRAEGGSPSAQECLEIAVAGAATPLACEPLPGTGAGYGKLRVPFELGRAAPLRLRVFFAGKRELVLDRVTLERAGG